MEHTEEQEAIGPLILRVDGKQEVLAYPDSMQARLTALQQAVGGYIEVVTIPGERHLLLVVNEDGRLKELPPNVTASQLAGQLIVGDVVLIPRELLD
jgi:Domain of unknown function (DUF3846)